MKKMRKNAGFTLVEMLIVVAIIAILIAVSIPLVSNSLEKARISTDQANERAAKAEATIIYLSGEYLDADGNPHNGWAGSNGVYTATYYAAEGSFDGGSDTTYGKCTTGIEGNANGANSMGHDGGYITATLYKDDGTVILKWSKVSEGIDEGATTHATQPTHSS